MKKNLAAIFAFIIVAVACHPAFAYDYSKLIPENPFFLMKINIKNLFESGMYKSFQPKSGAIFKAQQEINAEIERRLGFTFEKDIQEFGVFFGAAIDFNSRKPNNLFLYLTGKFTPEKIFAEIEKEKNVPFSIETIAGKKYIILKKEFSGTFINDETFVLGSPDMVEGLAAGKIKTCGPPESMKAQFEKSGLFVHFSLASSESRHLKEMFEQLAGMPGVPAPAQNVIRKIVSLHICDEDHSIVAKAEFSDNTVGADLGKLVEGSKMMAGVFLNSQEKAAEEKMKNASAFRLLGPEIAGVKLAAALGNDLLSSIETKAEGNNFILKMTVPEAYRTLIKPGSMPILIAVAGVGAAIAVPNFKRSREKAQDRACNANRRTLEGAVELYMMENGEPKGELTVDTLKEKGYLKYAPNCPKNGKYAIICETGKPVDIRCSFHGTSK